MREREKEQRLVGHRWPSGRTRIFLSATYALSRRGVREVCSASYASDRQDGIAQTSRHDTTTGARNSLISVARMHDLPLSVRPVVAVIRRRAFACPSTEPGFTRVTPFRNTAARPLCPRSEGIISSSGARTRRSGSGTESHPPPRPTRSDPLLEAFRLELSRIGLQLLSDAIDRWIETTDESKYGKFVFLTIVSEFRF